MLGVCTFENAFPFSIGSPPKPIRKVRSSALCADALNTDAANVDPKKSRRVVFTVKLPDVDKSQRLWRVIYLEIHRDH